MNEADVRFILVGGLAVNAYGYGRATVDVDLVVQLTPASIRLVFAALAGLGYAPRVPVSAAAFADPAQRSRWIEEKGMQVLNFHSDLHRETPVDIFVREPFDFVQEYERASVEEIAKGVTLRVVSLGSLLRLKREAGRPQDLADIAELRALHPGQTDE